MIVGRIGLRFGSSTLTGLAKVSSLAIGLDLVWREDLVILCSEWLHTHVSCFCVFDNLFNLIRILAF